MKNLFFFFLFSCCSLNLFGAKHILKFNLDRINKSEIRYTLIPDQQSTNAQSILIPHFIPSNYFEINTDDFFKRVKGYDQLGNIVRIEEENGRYSARKDIAYYEIDITQKTKLRDLKPGLHPNFKKNKFVSLALATICPIFASNDSILIKIKDDFSGNVQIDSLMVKGDELWKYSINKSKYSSTTIVNSNDIIICSNRKIFDDENQVEFITTAIKALSDHLQIYLPQNFTVFIDYDDRRFVRNHNLPKSEVFANGLRILINPEDEIIAQKVQILRALAWQLYRYIMPLQLNDDRIENLDPLLGHHSIHLWWYESVTEYLSLTTLVGTKLMEEDYFRQIMLEKIINTIEAPNYSLIQLASDYSRQNDRIKTFKNLKSYSAFQNRGVLAAMMLDISLLKESRYELGLMNEFENIADEGAQIQSTLFINDLTKDKGELYKQSIEHYILGIEEIALQGMLKLIDWQFFRKGEEHKTFIKGGYVSYFPEIEHYLCVKQGKNNVGLEKGDIILSVNGQKHFNLLDLDEIVFGGHNLRNEGRVKIEVLRNGQNIVLRGKADIDVTIKQHTIMPLFRPDSDAYQRRLKLLHLQ